MNNDIQKRIADAMANPQNMGELPNADAIGTVANSDCGEMLRLWIKYKEDRGRKIIDKATFQSFGCETAIAVASLATELIKGKTAEEALSLKTDELSGELGPLPPMKIHCAELVQGALRSALEPKSGATESKSSATPVSATTLLESLNPPQRADRKIVFLDSGSRQSKQESKAEDDSRSLTPQNPESEIRNPK
jgi:NifU-like protein involved in Fe-S cluster formation